jgi:carboxyl-terminal processing protease
VNKAKKEESDLEIRKEMERRVLQDRPIRFDWVIKRLLYRKANFNVLNGFAVLAGLLAILLLVPSCTTEDEVPDLSDEGTNGWIYKIMADYYLWNEDMPGKGNLNFSQSPDKFFDSLLSDQDGVKYGDGWLTFSRIEKKEEETKSVSESDSYGFEFASYKNGNLYYAWVLYVLPGSPAAEAGLERGDWIIAVGSETPNVTNLSAFYSGGETTFLLADAVRKGNEVTFYKRKTISVAASRAVEDTPFLKDSVYTVGGKKVGYLVYNSFSSGPDDESTIYDDRMKQVFAGFKVENVDEFILDLRYNQGGLVTCAQLMTSLLAPADALGKTFCEKYGWLLHPITLRIYNADHEADYANGFEPDVKIEELVIGNDLLPFGDTNERLLSEALSRISGLKSLPVHAESEGRILLTPSSLERKQTKGLIFEEGK